MNNYIIGAMFVFGFCMSSPVWEDMSWDSKAALVIIWPVALGSIVYEELNTDD